MLYRLRSFEDYTSDRDVATAVDKIQQLTHDKKVADLLRARHLHGVLRRYGGSTEKAKQLFQHAQQRQANHAVGAFTIINAKEEIKGIVTVLPTLLLRKQPYRIPPKLALGKFSQCIPTYGPDTTVWTHETVHPHKIDTSPLFFAYREILKLGGQVESIARARQKDDMPNCGTNAWRCEPTAVPHWIHAAITEAGLKKDGEGYFDDQEPAWIRPAYSRLYTRTPLDYESLDTIAGND